MGVNIDWDSLLYTTWSAVQASVSVILVLLYGYMIRKWNFISQEGENNMSKVSVTWFLPCLLFSQIGPLATWDNLKSYWIVIVLSVAFQLVSWAFGIFGVSVLGLPAWTTPCLVFNNATSLPLLLLESLSKVGTLSQIIEKGDTLDALMRRGRVYILINALVCNLTRFTFGPYLMSSYHPHVYSHEETPHIPQALPEKLSNPSEFFLPSTFTRASSFVRAASFSRSTPVQPAASSSAYPAVRPYPAINEAHEEGHETDPLLPDDEDEDEDEEKGIVHRSFRSMARLGVQFVLGFMNPPMWGGLAACVAGLVPFLRHWLFDDEGVLSPIAHSLSNLGALYTVLQMFVLGAHLYSKKTDKRPPIWALLYLFLYRFIIMPVISVGTIYLIRKHCGHLIKADPVLDFLLAIMPVGPPALTLAAIVEMADTGAETEAAVAQTIMLSYVVTPFISFSVSGALEVVQKMYS